MSGPSEAQHAWEDTFHADDRARPVAPRFHRLLMLDVRDAPTAADAARLEAALRALERRFARGPDGLLSCLGWGPGWFERFTALRSPVGRPVPMAPWEEPVLEDIDACLHLASDDEARLSAVTDELFGPGPLDLRGNLSLRQVRSGFVGAGLASERAPSAGVPVDALMFSPATSARSAALLADDAQSDADRLPALAAGHGLVGHAQAAARARLHGRPRINRRDFATVDDGRPGTHFVSLQRSLQDFNATRAVMNAADARRHHGGIGARHDNGINAFLDVRTRATFAVPPRSLRAYPHHEEGKEP